MKLMKLPVVTTFLLFLFTISACTKHEVPETTENPEENTEEALERKHHGVIKNNMVMFWNEKAALVLGNPNTPPAQARYFAMVQIAVHDALNAIKPRFEGYAMKNHRVKHANPDAAVASAAYHTITKLNLQGNFPVLDWYNQSLNTIPNGHNKNLGIALGEAAADSIILKRSTDNFNVANQQLPVPDGDDPGEYRSTLPFSNEGMPKIKALHQWGTQMKPFVIQANNQFRPVAPYPVNSFLYKLDYLEVKSKGGRLNHTRSAEQNEIGTFWVERSSIGWNRFARNIIKKKNLDAWKTARLFALMHTAMTDGITACFEAKYHYFYWRPETAIRLGNMDGNPWTSGDPAWLPGYVESQNSNPEMNINTPPIPDYPSAHANFGGAAAIVLKRFFGSDHVSVHQTSETLPGVTRYYNSILKAARDNSLSRIYVGFHFRKAVIEGENQGMQVGNYVYNNSFRALD